MKPVWASLGKLGLAMLLASFQKCYLQMFVGCAIIRTNNIIVIVKFLKRREKLAFLSQRMLLKNC